MHYKNCKFAQGDNVQFYLQIYCKTVSSLVVILQLKLEWELRNFGPANVSPFPLLEPSPDLILDQCRL